MTNETEPEITDAMKLRAWDDVTTQRDDLLEACKYTMQECFPPQSVNNYGRIWDMAGAVARLKSAIAQAEGGEPFNKRINTTQRDDLIAACQNLLFYVADYCIVARERAQQPPNRSTHAADCVLHALVTLRKCGAPHPDPHDFSYDMAAQFAIAPPEGSGR